MKRKRSSTRLPRRTPRKPTRLCPFCRTLVDVRKYDRHTTGCSRRPKDTKHFPGWVVLVCEGCGRAEVVIHTQWVNPWLLCESCREMQRETMQMERATAKAMRPRMPKSGWRMSGGLPSLGKKR